MWFDCVVIDKLGLDGILDTYHIRARSGEPITTDKLEDIDPTFRSANSSDIAGIRLYNDQFVQSRALQSKLTNFRTTPEGDIECQLDHWGIPVTFGYYAIIFPKGFRVSDIRIYDPYDESERLESKRLYRGISTTWDSHEEHSCAQILMRSKRSSFSLGVLAVLSPYGRNCTFSDRPGRLGIEFTEPRHIGHPSEASFRRATAGVTALAKKEDDVKFPDIKVGLSGPSISVNEAWKYGRYQWARWRRKASE